MRTRRLAGPATGSTWRPPGGFAPAETYEKEVGRHRTVTVALYRLGDVRALLELPGVDWEAVRGLPNGTPSPLREYAKLAPARADVVRGFAQRLADRHGVTVWAWNSPYSGGWEPDWERIEELPTEATVRRELADDPEAGSYASEITLCPTWGKVTREARALLERTASFEGGVVTSVGSAERLLERMDSAICHGHGMTCVWRAATAACRKAKLALGLPDDDAPDESECRSSCGKLPNLIWSFTRIRTASNTQETSLAFRLRDEQQNGDDSSSSINFQAMPSGMIDGSAQGWACSTGEDRHDHRLVYGWAAAGVPDVEGAGGLGDGLGAFDRVGVEAVGRRSGRVGRR